jgi:glycosyltransferase involved in cell wall biosynthesis
MHKSLAESLGVNAAFVDEKARWQDQGNSAIKNGIAWIRNAIDYRKYKNYDYILVDGLHFSPIIAKKLRILPKRTKIISHMGNQLPYFMLVKKLPKHSIVAHKWLFRNYDYICCEGNMIKEIILELIPEINKKLLLTFLGPLDTRVAELREITPDFNSFNMLTIASGPGYDRVFYKGIDLMIEAFVIAKKRLPQLTYTILGEWSNNDKQKLTQKYTPEEMEGVFFAGNTEDICTVIKASALSIHVARGDAFPTSTLEAMHAGLPVIVSEYTGTKQILKEVDMLLISELSSEKLSNRILNFFKLPIEQKEEISQKLKSFALPYTESNAKQHYKKTFENEVKK